MKNTIEYSGVNSINEREQKILNEIIEKEHPKICRLMKEDSNLKVHIKTMKKETAKRYIIIMHLETPTKMFTTKTKDREEEGDWDITKAAHKAVEHLKSEVEHKMSKF